MAGNTIQLVLPSPYPDGDREWWLEGVEYSAEEFNHILALKALNETLQTDLEEKEEKSRAKI